MNYIGYKVKHKLFGVGEIISQDAENRIIVRFSAGEKVFSAPKCFETFLTLQDAGARAGAKVHIEAQVEKERKAAETRMQNVLDKMSNHSGERKETIRSGSMNGMKPYVGITDWIIPCNPKYYDVFGAFDKMETIDWRQTAKNIEPGDSVYIYVADPVQAIAFKCQVMETLIPPDTYDVSDAEFNLTDPNEELGPYHINMRLKLVRKFPIDAITMNKMWEAGIKGNIQGPRRVTEELMELIRGYEEKQS